MFFTWNEFQKNYFFSCIVDFACFSFVYAMHERRLPFNKEHCLEINRNVSREEKFVFGTNELTIDQDEKD